MTVDIEKNKQEFNDLLRSVGREGTDYLIEDLEDLGFYDAPSSTRFHLACDGGNVQHSVIVACLLHDVCKADVYKKVVKKRKDQYGNWVDVKGFDVDYSNFPMGHGEKSVIVVLRSGFDIHDDEMLAIRWHMAAWDLAFQSPEQKKQYQHSPRQTRPLWLGATRRRHRRQPDRVGHRPGGNAVLRS